MTTTLAVPDIGDLIHRLRQVVGQDEGPVQLHEPSPYGNELAYLTECVRHNRISGADRFVERFERDLAEVVGSRHAVVTTSGTAALHLCLLLSGVAPGDEVLVPTLTYVATGNAVRYCGAVPHFVDADERSLGLDPLRLAEYLANIASLRDGHCFNRLTGRRIPVLVPMHTFGHPVDLDPLIEVCERFGLTLVEDAANALGSRYKGRHVGTFGRSAMFSFNGNKIITTGSGGVLVTDEAPFAREALHLASVAKRPHPWAFFHDQVGYNYRMPEINAAFGCAQLEQLPTFLAKKRALAERYRAALAGFDGARIFTEPDFAASNYWLCALLLEGPRPELRDSILAETHRAGLLTRPAWTPLHQLPMYQDCPRMDLTVAESLAARIINLPSSAALTPDAGQDLAAAGY
jgi:perosamine synthetase